MGPAAALALLRAHVLVVAVPGAPVLRLRAERAVRARGWLVVEVPEDADLLLVCGPTARAFGAAVDDVWARVPVPRARRAISSADVLEEVLDSAARALADDGLQRRSAPAPAAPRPLRHDGVAHLGPIGRDWPAGLLLDCGLDRRRRVTSVSARQQPMAPIPHPDPQDAALRRTVLDLARAAGLLRLSGWEPPASHLDGVVDRLLAGAAPEGERRRVRRVQALVARSAVLRWSLAQDAPGSDVRGRVLELLGPEGDPRPPGAVPEWGALLVGRASRSVPLIVSSAYPGGGRG